MENKDVHGLSPDPEGKKENPEPGSISSDQELQRLQEDVEKVKAAKNHLAKQEKQTVVEDAVGSIRETVEQEDRQLKQESTEQTIGEFAQQVETFMKEAQNLDANKKEERKELFKLVSKIDKVQRINI